MMNSILILLWRSLIHKWYKLIFELHAWDHKGMIGIGTHVRMIVDEMRFMEKLI